MLSVYVIARHTLVYASSAISSTSFYHEVGLGTPHKALLKLLLARGAKKKPFYPFIDLKRAQVVLFINDRFYISENTFMLKSFNF